MPFTTPLIVKRVSPREWELIAPLGYQGSVDHFVVPSGQRTDFASVPTWLQSFVQSTGAWTLAAVLHDDFCRHLAAGDCVVSSSEADGIFRRVMREDGVGLVKRWSMWSAVRLAALRSPARRPGIARDLPLALAIALGWLAVVVGVFAAVHLLIDWAASRL